MSPAPRPLVLEGGSMRHLAILASAISLAILWVAPTSAQKTPPRLEIFAEGGGSFITGSNGQKCTSACPTYVSAGPNLMSSFSTTGRLVVGGRFHFTRHDALEASYGFSPNHLTLQGAEFFPMTGLVEPISASSYNRLNLFSCNYVRYLWTRTPLQPFATGGIGMNHFSGPANATAVVEGLIGASNGFQFAWNFGGGTDIVLNRHFAIRLELRDYLAAQPSTTTGAIGNVVPTGTSHNIVPSAGVVYRFM
jgi:opacity protein-like surface antigen